MISKKPFVALFKTIWIFGLITFVWVASSVLDPVTSNYQTSPLSVYVDIPTDLAGVIAFIVAFAAFWLWEWLRQESE